MTYKKNKVVYIPHQEENYRNSYVRSMDTEQREKHRAEQKRILKRKK